MEKTYYPIDEETARIAHSMNSFSEYRSDLPSYIAEVDEAYDLADKAAKVFPHNEERVFMLADRYARKLAEWYNHGYRIESMCPSVMVAGPANFPTRKKDRQNIAREQHSGALKKVEGIKERIRSLGDTDRPILSDDIDAIARLEEKVCNLKEKHVAMKDANAAARKRGQTAPFASYTITNSRQALRDAERRLETLKTEKARETSEREACIEGYPVTIVENTEIMRLQVVFDCKPTEDIRAKLKKFGFRWSPKNVAWQRQLTGKARFALKCLLAE